MTTAARPHGPVKTLVGALLLLGLAGISGCQAVTQPGPLAAADEAAIRATTTAWEAAARQRDWAGVAATHTEDAILMPPYQPEVRGRAAIEAWYARLPNFTRMESTITEITGAGAGAKVGDIAVVKGTFAMTLSLPGLDPIEEEGKFLEVRRRQADGRWLIWRSSFNANTPRRPPPGPGTQGAGQPSGQR